MEGLHKIGHNSRKKLKQKDKLKDTAKNQADFDDLRNLKIGRKKG